MKLPEGMSRLDLVRQGLTGNLPKRGRFIVSITRLKEDPDNERKTFQNMEGLIERVKTQGIVEPITVTTEGDDMSHAGVPVIVGDRIDLLARGRHAGEMRCGDQGGLAQDPTHGVVRALTRGAARPVRHGDECGPHRGEARRRH